MISAIVIVVSVGLLVVLNLPFIRERVMEPLFDGTGSDGNTAANGDKGEPPPAPAKSPPPTNGTTNGNMEVTSTPEDDLRRAIEAYYNAVDAEKWDYTYNHLDSKIQEDFTRDEWSSKNQERREQPTWRPADYLGVDIDDETVTRGEQVTVTVYRTFPDDNPKDYDPCLVFDTFFIYEGDSWKHRLTEAERDLFMPDASYSDFEITETEYVESTVRGFYEAQDEGAFERAYCYGGPNFPSLYGSVEEWEYQQEQVNQIEGATINSPPEVAINSDSEATADVDVTFKDGSVNGTSRFTGNWTLVRDEYTGQWKLNSASLVQRE